MYALIPCTGAPAAYLLWLHTSHRIAYGASGSLFVIRTGAAKTGTVASKQGSEGNFLSPRVATGSTGGENSSRSYMLPSRLGSLTTAARMRPETPSGVTGFPYWQRPTSPRHAQSRPRLCVHSRAHLCGFPPRRLDGIRRWRIECGGGHAPFGPGLSRSQSVAAWRMVMIWLRLAGPTRGGACVRNGTSMKPCL
ncbi:hypothetical protein DAEQUDRAFT_223055 [Daedalea quercina L-15889]|uniref:Uncharacterized protein n=1 Tax=Daedalea quercina L-15889 TaxID=1314783 RepID=A0A165QYD5_9APHY|nr:hypothetical protein DAEQUDRAFT_223055 [Daedalea quercina L-15889]